MARDKKYVGHRVGGRDMAPHQVAWGGIPCPTEKCPNPIDVESGHNYCTKCHDEKYGVEPELSASFLQCERAVEERLQSGEYDETLPQPTIGAHDESKCTDGRRIVSRSGDR